MEFWTNAEELEEPGIEKGQHYFWTVHQLGCYYLLQYGSSKSEIEVGSKEYQDTNEVHEVRFMAVRGLENIDHSFIIH